MAFAEIPGSFLLLWIEMDVMSARAKEEQIPHTLPSGAYEHPPLPITDHRLIGI